MRENTRRRLPSVDLFFIHLQYSLWYDPFVVQTWSIACWNVIFKHYFCMSPDFRPGLGIAAGNGPETPLAISPTINCVIAIFIFSGSVTPVFK